MRTAIVPAQVTTVEDKIAGNVSFSQLLLLIVPLFAGSGLYIALPPAAGYAAYKAVMVVCLVAGCGVLAIRFHGKILLIWLLVLLRYRLRPRYYVFDKNSLYGRESASVGKRASPVGQDEVKLAHRASVVFLSTEERVGIEELMANPAIQVQFKAGRKGGLSVRLTEISKSIG